MPVDNSKRLEGLLGMVRVLQGITTGAGFQFDLSGDGQVSLAVEMREARLETMWPVTVRVTDGQENFRSMHLGRGTEGQLDILVHAMMRDLNGESMVEQVNDLLRDIHRAIDNNRGLDSGGAIASADVTQVEQPGYDIENQAAEVLVHVLARYDYTAGQSL